MRSIAELLKKVDNKDFADITNEELTLLKLKWYNDSIGNLNENDGVNCDECHNKGFIQYINDKDQVYMRECKCMKIRKQINRAKKSGLGEYLKKRSVDYKTEEEWQILNKKVMVEYCTEHSQDNIWFAALGNSGSGKTLMCSIIANHLLFNLNMNVQYITWTDFISGLKRDMMGDKSNEVSQYLEDLKNVEVLFIDELLKKYNDTDLKYIIEIINYRYSNDLKTLVTSERNINELLDIDEATFSRMIEKCGKFYIDIPKDRSKNYRLKHILK